MWWSKLTVIVAVLLVGDERASQTAAAPPQESKPGLEPVLQAVQELEDRAIRAETLRRIGDLQAKAGLRDEAWKTLRQAKEVADAIPDGVARTNALLSVTYSQSVSGDLKGMEEKVQRIRHEKSMAYCVAWTAKAHALAGRRQAARQKFLDAVQWAETLSTEVTPGAVDSDRDWALEMIAQAQAECGEEQGALATANLLAKVKTEPGKEWRVWHQVAVARAGAGDFRGALQMVQNIKDDYQRRLKAGELPKNWVPDVEGSVAHVLRDVALNRVAAGRLDEARKVAELMFEGRSNSLDLERNSVLVVLARAHAERGDIKQARKVSERLSDYHKPLALAVVARGLVRLGDGVEARKGLNEAFELAKTLGQGDYYAVTEGLLAIADGYVQLGEMATARKVATTIKNPSGAGSHDFYDTELPLGPSKSGVSMLISRAHSRAGDIEGALRAAEEIQEEAGLHKLDAEILKTYCYRDIARAKMKAQGAEGALTWARGRPTAAERAAALQGVAQGILEQKAPRK